MEIKPISTEIAWNELLALQPPTSFLQSWEWGDFQHTVTHSPIRLAVYEQEKPLLYAQIMNMRTKRGNFLFIPHGPVVFPQVNQTEILRYFYSEITKLAKKHSCHFIRISPPLVDTAENHALYASLSFRDAPIYLHAETMWELDITPPEDQLLAAMRKTTRYSIRKAEKEGATIEIKNNQAGLDIFYALYEQTVNREQFSPYSKKYITHEWEAFARTGNAVILVGKEKDAGYTAAALMICTKQGMYYHQGASLHSKIPTAYLLQWEAMKEAKRRGCTLYNFWGIYRPGRTPKAWQGLTLFKQGFGGKQIDYIPTQDLPLSPFYRLTYLYEKILFLKRKAG